MMDRLVQNPFASGVRISGMFVVLMLAAFLLIFVSPVIVFGGLLGATLVWAVIFRPTSTLATLLAIMPIHFLVIALGKFYGLPNMSAVSICTKEVPFLLLMLVLWQRNGFKPTLPDWFAAAFLAIALVRSAFGGFFMGLADDVVFLIPYAIGRVTVLTEAQERLWAKCAVWIAAVLSVVGIGEMFILGEGPRKLLLAVAFAEDDLSGFRAGGYEGIRASSTMEGPLAFGALCMIALIIWWVYFRNAVPAGVIFAGLVCSLSRSAWIGAAAAISVLAFKLSQKGRLVSCGLLAAVLLVAAVPLLEIHEFVSTSAAGQDESTGVHVASLKKGLEYVANHPFGSGGGSIGFRATKNNAVLENIESSYLTYGANYGVLAVLSFGALLLSALRRTWKAGTPMGHVATGTLIGFGIMMLFEPMHTSTHLNSWVWLPIGLSLRSTQETRANA